MAILERGRNNPKITEHPVYQSWIGIIAAKHYPPLLDKAQESFKFASSLTRLDPCAARQWYYLELMSGTGIETAIRICNKILDDVKLSEESQNRVLVKEGLCLENKGRESGRRGSGGNSELPRPIARLSISEPTTTLLNCQLSDLEKLSVLAGQSAISFAWACIRNEQVKLFFETLDEYASRKLACDPAWEGYSCKLCDWDGRRSNAPDIDRAIAVLNHFPRSFRLSPRPLVFLDPDHRNEIVSTLARTAENSKHLREQFRAA